MQPEGPSVEVLQAESEKGGLPVVIGVPLERGAVRDTAALTLIGPDGQARPVAVRALSAWPDGSVRWALLAFEATQKGRHTVSAASGAACAAPPQPVTLTSSSDEAAIDNGLVRVVVSADGPGPIREVRALGHSFLGLPEDLRFVVGDADTTREKARTIEVMENSPLRARVRVKGAHFDASGARLLDYRLDVELWAGWPTLRVDYHFFNLEKGREEIQVDRMAMEWDVALGAKTQRHFVQSMYSLRYVPREVINPSPVAIVADETRGAAHVEDPAMLLDDIHYPLHLRPPLVDSSDWLGVSDGTRSLYVRMQDFAAMRPKRLASDGSKLELEFWPASQGKLTLFQGRSRRQVVTFAFCDSPKLSPADVQRLLDGPLCEGRAVIGPQWLRQRGEFECDRVVTPGVNVRFEKFLHRLVSLHTPQDMFDLGDTIDSGYCRSYITIGNAQPLKRNAPEMPRVFLAVPHSVFAEWAIPQLYEPVWTNNEYDAIHALCTEIMRTGRGELWQHARWFVRHNIEVDFVHYHDDLQQSRGTPQHSFKHNRSGAILSHFWTQGLLEYYCMTGDQDVLEIATALGDKIIEDLTLPELREAFWGFTRELGWPTLALAHLYDITREQRFLKQLEEIVAFFMSYDRGKFRGPINLSGADARFRLERQMVGSFFGYASMVEGVDLYHRLSGRADVKAWLEELVEDVRQSLDAAHSEGQPLSIAHMHLLGMAVGYEQTGDARFLHSGMVCLDEFLDSPWWVAPPPEAKPVAMLYRGLVRFLHHAQQAGLLARLEWQSMRR